MRASPYSPETRQDKTSFGRIRQDLLRLFYNHRIKESVELRRFALHIRFALYYASDVVFKQVVIVLSTAILVPRIYSFVFMWQLIS